MYKSRLHDTLLYHTLSALGVCLHFFHSTCLSFSRSRAQCQSFLPGHLPFLQLTSNHNSHGFFFLHPHFCYSAFYLPFFFLSQNKETEFYLNFILVSLLNKSFTLPLLCKMLCNFLKFSS